MDREACLCQRSQLVQNPAQLSGTSGSLQPSKLDACTKVNVVRNQDCSTNTYCVVVLRKDTEVICSFVKASKHRRHFHMANEGRRGGGGGRGGRGGGRRGGGGGGGGGGGQMVSAFAA